MGNTYAGMTVNERLYVSGLMDKFDEAVKKNDIKEIRIILEKVELSTESINLILKELNL